MLKDLDPSRLRMAAAPGSHKEPSQLPLSAAFAKNSLAEARHLIPSPWELAVKEE